MNSRPLHHSIVRLAPVSWMLVVIAAGLGAAPAHAHTLPRERTVTVQASADAVEVMIVFLEPPSRRARLLVERFDLNGDGRLRGGEAQLAGHEWIGQTLHGLRLEVDGEQPRAHEPTIKFHREQKGSLSAAVYARWDLPRLKPAQTRTIHVRLLDGPSAVATEVTFRGADDTQITRVDLPARLQNSPARPVLAAGEQATARLRLNPSSDPDASQ